MDQIHRFKYKDKYLVFDVESSALHELSPDAWEVLNRLEKGQTGEDTAGGAAKNLRPEQSSALDELENLREQGLLWSERSGCSVQPEPVVKALCLFATDDCNLNCRYCFTGRKPLPGNAAMSLEVAKAAVDLLLEASGERRHCEIDFFGGEPLLNWGTVLETADYAREAGAARGKEVAMTLTTNGLLLDERIMERLERDSFAVVLSLDGRPGVHDRMRPRKTKGGSYKDTVSRQLAYVNRTPPGGYYVRGTFTRFNLDFCSDIRHMYDLGYRYISMEPVVAPSEAGYALRDSDLPRIAEEYENLVGFYLERLEAGDPFYFFHFNIDLEGGPCLQKRLTGCGAGMEYLAVTPGGYIYPCHQLAGEEKFMLGDVFHAEALNLGDGKIFLSPGPFSASCRHCWARYHCGGGCKAAAYLNGDPDTPYPLECAMQKMRLECALYLQAAKGSD